VEDLEDEVEVIDTRRDPADRLNSRAVMVADGSEGMCFWMIGFVRAFFLAATMVVADRGATPSHVESMNTLYRHAANAR